MSNENEALGMPPGSVRAILALIIIPITVLASASLMILMFVRNQYTEALGILSGLTGIAGSVVGYYFGTKSSDKATKEITQAHLREIDSKDRHIDVLSRGLNLNPL